MTETLRIPRLGARQLEALQHALGHDGGSLRLVPDHDGPAPTMFRIVWADDSERGYCRARDLDFYEVKAERWDLAKPDAMLVQLAWLIGSTLDIARDNEDTALIRRLERVAELLRIAPSMLQGGGLQVVLNAAGCVPSGRPGERWFASCADGVYRCDPAGYATRVEAADWADYGHGCLSPDSHRVWSAVVPEGVGRDDLVFYASPPIRELRWNCETDQGAPFFLTFSSGEQEQMIHAWWLAQHDYCRPCDSCRECHHPDHENYCPADGGRWTF